MQDVQATMQPLVSQNKNTLNVEVSGNIGSMYTDLTKVRQLLLNLLSNTAKFTEQGTITLSVNSVLRGAASFDLIDRFIPSADALTPWITFTVSDTGIGMSLEQLETVFQAFTQADPIHHPQIWWHRAGAGH